MRGGIGVGHNTRHEEIVKCLTGTRAQGSIFPWMHVRVGRAKERGIMRNGGSKGRQLGQGRLLAALTERPAQYRSSTRCATAPACGLGRVHA